MSLAVTFLTEATEASGLGHIGRCLALAEALEERAAKCRFVGPFDGRARRILDATNLPYDSRDPGTPAGREAVIGHLVEQNADALVVDSYGIGDDDLTAMRGAAGTLLVIDDFANLKVYPCDAILNFTVSAPRLEYPASVPVRLLGTGYFLARRALRRVRANTSVGPPNRVKKVLVAIGGVDRHDLTRRSLEALLECDLGLMISAVVAADHPRLETLESLLNAFHPPGRLVVNAPTLAEELSRADVCISGGGLTKYEAAYLAIPTAVLSQTPQQAEETVHFAAAGLGLDLGLGPQVQDRHLVLGLESFLQDTTRLSKLHQSCMSSFPQDPTARAAGELAHLAENAMRG